MAYSEGCLVNLAKDNPEMAEQLWGGTKPEKKSFNELWMETDQGLSEVVDLTPEQIVVLENWIHKG